MDRIPQCKTCGSDTGLIIVKNEMLCAKCINERFEENEREWLQVIKSIVGGDLPVSRTHALQMGIEKVTKLNAALRYYGNKRNYEDAEYGHQLVAPIELDKGKKARVALGFEKA